MTLEEKKQEFLSKWTVDYKPPKDNEAEKNQRGTLDEYKTVKENREAAKNWKKKRKNKNIRRIVDEI